MLLQKQIMKTLLLTILAMTFSSTALFDFKVKNIEGNTIDLTAFKGKKILIVNTASECGFTPQYEDLQKLYSTYKDKLVIIGFPANNFGGQEPGTNSEIKSFCSKNYGVTFPMMGKVSVKGNGIDPLFAWLTTEPNPDFTGDIKWNFEKFLLDENGKLIHRFKTRTSPMSDEIVNLIK